jgi:hypothetical protein
MYSAGVAYYIRRKGPGLLQYTLMKFKLKGTRNIRHASVWHSPVAIIKISGNLKMLYNNFMDAITSKKKKTTKVKSA